MSRDELIAMAREAHRALVTQDYPGHRGQLDPWTLRLLERFAALVAAREREACAQVCDHYAHAKDYGGNTYMRSQDCKNAATAIRARCAT